MHLPHDQHIIVSDLSFGDAGKGTTIDYLASTGRYSLVVRFNGGAQAGHGVVMPDGREHAFSQFGAGTFHGLPTHLSRFSLVDPGVMAVEAGKLEALGVSSPFDMISVDKRALLVTPYHKELNKLREEARGAGRHGSCGMGIGETMAYAQVTPDHLVPRVADCLTPDVLIQKLKVLRAYVRDTTDAMPELKNIYKGMVIGRRVPTEAEIADMCLAFAETVELTDENWLSNFLHQRFVLFEGAQGVLLDEARGFHPYTTWSTTSFDNAETLLEEAGETNYYKLGILRTYTTRHGAGPFPTEDERLGMVDWNNSTGQWQGSFRNGHFDMVLHRYAAHVAQPDGLMITHCDTAAANGDLRMCKTYEAGGVPVTDLVPGVYGDLDHQEQLTALLLSVKPRFIPVSNWISEIEEGIGVPCVLTSWGPTHEHKQEIQSLLE